ncbi:hypothetical protein HUE56_08260 (plasmid) [Azospirillum oryzae]|uniref:OB domain-containing protein n=1 Tax=Azospirillum oryzae TaxID=286727 RepID=A0A6N1AGD4_9PROT|nr:hypothetical protein [Azospirillum oryzae]KAA0587419.1 hypothetical protein FZ938_18375 [Azospirillum oryzae]QKS50329.1 hypothetical protein HUE56_08260 [Azospirillum oryzae]
MAAALVHFVWHRRLGFSGAAFYLAILPQPTSRPFVRQGRLVLVRQRPGSANGVLFLTLEDETGVANIIVWKKLFEQRRRIILGASMHSFAYPSASA